MTTAQNGAAREGLLTRLDAWIDRHARRLSPSASIDGITLDEFRALIELARTPASQTDAALAKVLGWLRDDTPVHIRRAVTYAAFASKGNDNGK